MRVVQKIAKICDTEMLKSIPLPIKKLSVTYYQTLEDAPWPLELEKLE